MARKKPPAKHDGEEGQQGEAVPLTHATSGTHEIRAKVGGQQGEAVPLTHATSGTHEVRAKARDRKEPEFEQREDEAERTPAPNESDLDQLLAAEYRPPPLSPWTLGMTLGASALGWYLIWLTWPTSGYVFAGLVGLLALDFTWRKWRGGAS